MCGVIVSSFTVVEITGGYGADYHQCAPLVETTARRFQIYEVSADRALNPYLGRRALGGCCPPIRPPKRHTASSVSTTGPMRGSWEVRESAHLPS
jgi:hypothetical protein